MNRFRLIVNSLLHYWRTNLAVLMGVVAGTAVIGGALIVGDSVRGSLRQMTMQRLGRIDFVISGPRFFRQDLADDLRSQNVQAAPAIIMLAGIKTLGESSRRASQVSVYGLDDSGWSLIETGSIDRPHETQIVLNAQAAEALQVKVGDDVTVWIELPSAVPRDTLLGRKDNDSQEITLTVSAIAPAENGLSRLGLNPTQALPLNAFVDLSVLQERLDQERIRPTRHDPFGKTARVNSLLVTGPEPLDLQKTRELVDQYNQAVRQVIQLSDLNLRLVHDEELNCEVLESEQMILEDKISQAAARAGASLELSTSPVMVYLANSLWNPALDVGPRLARAMKGDKSAEAELRALGEHPGFSMYSTVAGLDIVGLRNVPFGRFEFLGDAPSALGPDDVVINDWLAADLKLAVGDRIRLSYHLIGSRGELPEEELEAVVQGIVKMTGPATDRTLTPQVKGITDVESLADWDQPFEMKLDLVTARDDGYWDKYRATPKLFLPLSAAQAHWPSRYGTLTSMRFGSPEWKQEKVGLNDLPAVVAKRHGSLGAAILQEIDPVDLGLAFQPVKAIGLMAANGSTDFSQLFFGFSLFLIVAAMLLIGLLFRLGIEQRVRDLGLLSAVGFTPRQVRQQMLGEGAVVVVAGGFVGLLAAVAYAQLMIYGLTHWWVGAIGTRDLSLFISASSLPIGFAIAVAAGLISIWWALRQLKTLSIREQLSGITERDVDRTILQKRTQTAWRRAIICSALAALVALGLAAGLIPAAAAFFIIGILTLVASLSFLSGWLLGSGQQRAEMSLRGTGIAVLARLGIKNAARQRLRSVMTAGMIATATFLIVTVAAFRRDPTGDRLDRKSGNGGFTLVAEASTPLLYDLNTAEGRKKLQLAAPPGSAAARALAEMRVVPFRVKPGDDASCLNLYQTRVPRILGAPQSLIDDNRFAFASGNWKVLNPPSTPEASDPATGKPIPVLGDMNTLMFSLHKSVGQSIAIPDDEHPQYQLNIAGMFQDSVFQGVLVMSEKDFLQVYPEQKGFRYFLIEVPPELAEVTTTLLESELAEYGVDCEPVAERLARFLSVQNTYLSTFQTLGGLGLLLGTFGLATVMLRNVLERQAELALLRAVGFRAASVGTLVLLENAFVLICGLLAGSLSAFLAVAPNLASRSGDVPVLSLFGLLAVVLVTGMLASAFAVLSAIRLPIVATLRGE